MLKKNAAVALGLLGIPSAGPVLREMVAARDGFIPFTCVKYTYTHATTAIYLLGKLRDFDSVEVLLDVIRTKGAFEDKNFTPDELYAAADDVRFQYISYALTALGRIAEKYPELKPNIKAVVTQTLLNDKFSLSIS